MPEGKSETGWVEEEEREREPRKLVLSAPSRGSALLSYVFETGELSREVRKRGGVYQNLEWRWGQGCKWFEDTPFKL